MKGSAPRSPLLALAAAVLLARSAAAFSAPCALLQSPLLLRSPPRFSQQFALPELQDAARIRGGRSVEVGMVLNKLFGRGKDQAGKEGGVAENKYGVRFEAMLNSVQDYGEAEILLVENERLRTILRGIVDGSKQPDLRGAFKVLYEDLPPVRLGGDMLFSVVLEGLSSSVAKAPEAARKLPVEQLALARDLFAAADADGSGRVDCTELEAFLSALRLEGIASGGEAVASDSEAETAPFQGREGLSFAEFAAEAGGVLAWDDAKSSRLRERLREGKQEKESAKGKHDARFKVMMEDVVRWGGDFDSESLDPRRAAVIKGTVAGAGVPSVAQALRVIYVDYAPLRFVGNTIFSIVRSSIGS